MVSPNSINRNFKLFIASAAQTNFTYDFWVPSDVVDAEIFCRVNNVLATFTHTAASKLIVLDSAASEGDEVIIYRKLLKKRTREFTIGETLDSVNTQKEWDKLIALHQDNDWIQGQFSAQFTKSRGENGTFTVMQASKNAFTIDHVVHESDSGTIDFTILVNDSAHADFTTIGLGNTATTTTPASTWTINPNDKITITLANNNDAVNVGIVLQCTKTG